jgi:hypothetical protein
MHPQYLSVLENNLIELRQIRGLSPKQVLREALGRPVIRHTCVKNQRFRH